MTKYYFSKNYKETKSAGNKAKTDIEAILLANGYKRTGIRADNKNVLLGFIITFAGLIKTCFSLKSNSLLVIQYPLKKYYTFLCRVAHLHNCKVVTIIHDLGSFRGKRLTIEQEISRLNNSDYVIAHNDTMSDWLKEHNARAYIQSLKVFDYLSTSNPDDSEIKEGHKYRVLYAGAFSSRKNHFVNQMDDIIKSYKFNLYGAGHKAQEEKNNMVTYKGFVLSDTLIATADGDFGLVWEGESINTCSGGYGEYLQLNNPHKCSLYIRCHLPIFIWRKAALAPFVKENNIGFCIDSLEEIEKILSKLSKEEYKEIRNNVIKISNRLASGYYVLTALENIIDTGVNSSKN